MTGTPTGKATRAERMTMPLARQVVQDLAVEHGACIRPIQLRRTNLDTGQVEPVLVPCGHTLADVCPSCAERARSLGLSGLPFHEPFHADGRRWSMTVTERSDRNRRLRRRQRDIPGA